MSNTATKVKTLKAHAVLAELQEQARQDREAAIQRMKEKTIDLAVRNSDARRHLERSQLAGLNPNTGQRWI